MNEEEELKTQAESDIATLNAAIENFKNCYAKRSFADRRPDVGKMINCDICDRRHRSSFVCAQIYSAEAKPRHRHIRKAKRHNPHINQNHLQLIERTRQIVAQNLFRNGSQFPLLGNMDLMKTSRATAERQLDEEREIEAKRIRRQQDVSRRINRSLLPGGSR